MDSQQVLEKVLEIVRAEFNPPVPQILPDSKLEKIMTEWDFYSVLHQLINEYPHLPDLMTTRTSAKMKELKQRFATPNMIVDWVMTESLVLETA